MFWQQFFFFQITSSTWQLDNFCYPLKSYLWPVIIVMLPLQFALFAIMCATKLLHQRGHFQISQLTNPQHYLCHPWVSLQVMQLSITWNYKAIVTHPPKHSNNKGWTSTTSKTAPFFQVQNYLLFDRCRLFPMIHCEKWPLLNNFLVEHWIANRLNYMMEMMKQVQPCYVNRALENHT